MAIRGPLPSIHLDLASKTEAIALLREPLAEQAPFPQQGLVGDFHPTSAAFTRGDEEPVVDELIDGCLCGRRNLIARQAPPGEVAPFVDVGELHESIAQRQPGVRRETVEELLRALRQPFLHAADRVVVFRRDPPRAAIAALLPQLPERVGHQR